MLYLNGVHRHDLYLPRRYSSLLRPTLPVFPFLWFFFVEAGVTGTEERTYSLSCILFYFLLFSFSLKLISSSSFHRLDMTLAVKPQ